MGETLREKILNGIGLSLVLLCFVAALGRVTWSQLSWVKHSPETDPVTIRFAHWQLEGGVRDAFEDIAQEYMKLHPHVKVMQIPVPDRIYTNWLITQLVGETAPDIIEMGIGMSEDRTARFFTPMSELADLPNPWNKGTDLEGVPLRESFLDGMEGCFNNNLLEYYGVPISAYTVRMFYNLDLLKEITGKEALPDTYSELVDLSRNVMEYSRRTGRNVFPIAGSKYNAPYIMDRLFTSQTSQLSDRVGYDSLANRTSVTKIATAAANGAWTLEDPQIRAGLSLMRDLGQYMQPGFLQLGRDDASFYFVQGKALMICTGSWDATSISSQADFRVGVGSIPVPEPGDKVGPYSEGPSSDSMTGTGIIMALTRGSKNPEVALDFLLFLASKPMNQLFTQVSKWPPSVAGVVPDPQAKPFQPVFDGYLGGFNLDFSGGDSKRVIANALNRLVRPAGSVDAFIQEIRPAYLSAIESDLVRSARGSRATSQRSDTTLGALAWMSLQDSGDKRMTDKLDMLSQSVTGSDLSFRRLEGARNIVKKSVE